MQLGFSSSLVGNVDRAVNNYLYISACIVYLGANQNKVSWGVRESSHNINYYTSTHVTIPKTFTIYIYVIKFPFYVIKHVNKVFIGIVLVFHVKIGKCRNCSKLTYDMRKWLLELIFCCVLQDSSVSDIDLLDLFAYMGLESLYYQDVIIRHQLWPRCSLC